MNNDARARNALHSQIFEGNLGAWVEQQATQRCLKCTTATLEEPISVQIDR